MKLLLLASPLITLGTAQLDNIFLAETSLESKLQKKSFPIYKEGGAYYTKVGVGDGSDDEFKFLLNLEWSHNAIEIAPDCTTCGSGGYNCKASDTCHLQDGSGTQWAFNNGQITVEEIRDEFKTEGFTHPDTKFWGIIHEKAPTGMSDLFKGTDGFWGLDKNFFFNTLPIKDVQAPSMKKEFTIALFDSESKSSIQFGGFNKNLIDTQQKFANPISDKAGFAWASSSRSSAGDTDWNSWDLQFDEIGFAGQTPFTKTQRKGKISTNSNFIQVPAAQYTEIRDWLLKEYKDKVEVDKDQKIFFKKDCPKLTNDLKFMISVILRQDGSQSVQSRMPIYISDRIFQKSGDKCFVKLEQGDSYIFGTPLLETYMVRFLIDTSNSLSVNYKIGFAFSLEPKTDPTLIIIFSVLGVAILITAAFLGYRCYKKKQAQKQSQYKQVKDTMASERPYPAGGNINQSERSRTVSQSEYYRSTIKTEREKETK